MLYHLFPISSSASWVSQSSPEQCSEKISSWLYDHNSLTQKLESLCQEFQVQVRQQRTISATSPLLSGYFSNDTQVLVREVFLCCDGVPVVFAQTEIPHSTLTAEQTQLAEIGTESLGRILFQDASMKRGAIEIAHFTEKSQLPDLSPQLKTSDISSLWARRSLFYLNDKPLLVSELFLPALGIYSE
jgi:chorismate--pyruvate lyase